MSEKKNRAMRKIQPARKHGGPPGSAIGRPVEKAKNFKGTLKRLLTYLKPQLPKFIIVLIFAIVSTVFTVQAPKKMGDAINQITDGFIAKSTVNTVSDMQKKAVPEIKKQINSINEAEQQAANQAKAAVAARFAKQPNVTKQQLESAQNEAAKQAKDAVQNAILEKGKLTSEQLDAMKELASLPNVKDIKGNNQKADTVQKLIDLSKKMPQSNSGKTIKVSKTDMDKGIADVRKYGDAIPFGPITNTLLILVSFYVLGSVFQFLMSFIMSGVAQSTVHDMRRDLQTKMSRLPLRYFDSHPNGDTLSRMTNDIDTISTTLQQSLTQLITSILQLIGYV
ncbi:MAG TPA: ABC transporter transmembrane domain-containing protein, partial [Ruminiclostridium sp.]|nr:ABC transporter transmembrane domain-containing protein [Ruminiclostridium sp.]